MTVYVDDMEAPFGRMKMCHMYADTIAELHTMADRIGVARRWFQNAPGSPHYDICLSKKRLALAAGAIASQWRHYGAFQGEGHKRSQLALGARDTGVVPAALALLGLLLTGCAHPDGPHWDPGACLRERHTLTPIWAGKTMVLMPRTICVLRDSVFHAPADSFGGGR